MRLTGIFVIILFFCLQASAQSDKDIAAIRKEGDSLIENTSYGKNASAGKYYELRGIKMYCEIYGQGEPLLFIHGNGGSINNFVKQIPYFSTRYKVIIADSRAQGNTKDAGDSLSYEMMADDYDALLTALHIDSAYVVGWSDGGINGLLLAIRHPRKVKKLAVTGANLQPDTSAVDPWVYNMVQKQYGFMKQFKQPTPEVKQGLKLMHLLCDEPHISLDALHTIAAPTLVMGGDHDVLKPEHTLQIFRNIPRAYLWIFPNSGHSTPIVYADEFNRKIDRFFQSPYRKIEGEANFF